MNLEDIQDEQDLCDFLADMSQEDLERMEPAEGMAILKELARIAKEIMDDTPDNIIDEDGEN